jgi:chemotaxis protein methyltransferase CheR
MEATVFQYLCELLKKRSGLALTADKEYLIESRLLPVARTHNCNSVSALILLIRTAVDPVLLNEVIEAMTTNESLFFRDTKPFEYLRKTLLPAYKAQAGKSVLRIWSAACSTGQEPYSIAMCLQEESAKMPGWKYEIVATDLASKVIEKSKEAVYSQFEVQRGLPIQMLVKYFTQLPDASWQIKEPLRAMVAYRVQNLLEDFSTLGRFDIVFCRNVLIYFDEPTKAVVVERLAKVLGQGGQYGGHCG